MHMCDMTQVRVRLEMEGKMENSTTTRNVIVDIVGSDKPDEVCCGVLRCVAVWCGVVWCVAVCCGVWQCGAVCCDVLRCVAVCCSVLQCVAVCCNVECHSLCCQV